MTVKNPPTIKIQRGIKTKPHGQTNVPSALKNINMNKVGTKSAAIMIIVKTTATPKEAIRFLINLLFLS